MTFSKLLAEPFSAFVLGQGALEGNLSRMLIRCRLLMLFSQRAEVAVKVQKDIELLPLINSLKKERLVRRVMAMCTGAPLITQK
jgi:hypothetical protein